MDLIFIITGVFLLGAFTGGILNVVWPKVKYTLLWFWIKIRRGKPHKTRGSRLPL